MTETLKAAMLPPIALLREREWGRDIIAIARSEWERVSNIDIVDRLVDLGNRTYVEAAVIHHRMCRTFGTEHPSLAKLRSTFNEEQASIYLKGRLFEVELATALERFVETGSKIISIGPELHRQFEGDQSISLSHADLPSKRVCFYVHLEGYEGPGVDGLPLDGFIVDFDPEHEVNLTIAPLSKTSPPMGHSGTMEPMILLSLNEEEDLSSAIATRADELEELIANSRKGRSDSSTEVRDVFGEENVDLMSRVAWSHDLESYEATEIQVDIMRREAIRWGRIVIQAIRCVVGNEHHGLPDFAPGAPADLVEKVRKGGPGSRKIQQRLVAAGFPPVTRFEIGNVPSATPEKPASTDKKTASKAAAGRTEIPIPAQEPRIDRRKARKLAKSATRPETMKRTPVDGEGDEKTPEPSAQATPVIVPAPADKPAYAMENAGPARHDPVLLESLDSLLQRCFRDLPAVGSRNWETTLPPALASMIIRRSSVPRLPRETGDATRKRLAADIQPRLEGIIEIQKRLRSETEANDALRRAMEIGRPSVLRDVDPQIAEDLAHPLLVAVRDDEHLAALIGFPGVDIEQKGRHERVTIVQAWRDGRSLHLMGYVHGDCMLGFRRVRLDLDSDEVFAFDGDADSTDVDILLESLYAPVADALLGPVDESDAWMHERRVARRLRQHRPMPNSHAPVAVPEASENDHPALAEWIPDSSEFERWESVSRPVLPLADTMRKTVDEIMGRNAVSRAAMMALDADGLTTEDASSLVRRAFTRHLASMAKSGGRIDPLASPDIPDEVDLSTINDGDGVLVVSDRALFEHASPGLLAGHSTLRETPICVLYRVRREGVSAFMVQPTVDGHINLAQWIRIPLLPSDEEGDLSWYLRGAISLALCGSGTVEVAHAPEVTTLPAFPQKTHGSNPTMSKWRQGPRRIVAQVRMRPESLGLAVAASEKWFDEQVRRHGLNLVEDRREAGQWTIENECHERGVRSRWSVTLKLAESDGHSLDIVVRTTLATGVRPRLPALVREIAAATPSHGPDGLLHLQPPVVRTRSDLNDLLRHLQSPDRRLPTLLISRPPDGDIGHDPADLAVQSVGAMNIRIIDDRMTYELAEALGQEYRTFGGAVRLFQPNFEPDHDNPARHPRLMNDSAGKRAVSDLITRATSQTVTRYDIPDTVAAPDTAPDTAPAKAAADTPAPANGVNSTDEEAAEQARAQAVADELARKANEPDLPFAEVLDVPSDPHLSDEDPQSVVQEAVPSPSARSFLPTPHVAPKEEPSAQPAPSVPQAPSAPHIDVEEVAHKVARILSASATPPAFPPEEGGEKATSLEDISIEQRIEMSVASRFAALGVGDLVGAVTLLVGRIDAMLSSPQRDQSHERPQDGQVSSQKDAEILRLQDELRRERDSSMQLLEEADAQRTAAVAEVSVLRRALNDRRRQAEGGRIGTTWPSDLSGLAEWVEHNALPNVVITAKAYREMRKVRYTDMERLCRTLQLLDGAYVDMRAGEDGARERWEEGLKELRLEQKKQTRMGKGIRGGAEYRFEHEGVRWEMDYHLRGTESLYNEHDRLLRIYYAFDKEEGRVLIGHMPTHLTTIDS